MNFYKKLLLGLTSIALLFSLCSCFGGGEESSESSESTGYVEPVREKMAFADTIVGYRTLATNQEFAPTDNYFLLMEQKSNGALMSYSSEFAADSYDIPSYQNGGIYLRNLDTFSDKVNKAAVDFIDRILSNCTVLDQWVEGLYTTDASRVTFVQDNFGEVRYLVKTLEGGFSITEVLIPIENKPAVSGQPWAEDQKYQLTNVKIYINDDGENVTEITKYLTPDTREYIGDSASSIYSIIHGDCYIKNIVGKSYVQNIYYYDEYLPVNETQYLGNTTYLKESFLEISEEKKFDEATNSFYTALNISDIGTYCNSLKPNSVEENLLESKTAINYLEASLNKNVRYELMLDEYLENEKTFRYLMPHLNYNDGLLDMDVRVEDASTIISIPLYLFKGFTGYKIGENGGKPFAFFFNGFDESNNPNNKKYLYGEDLRTLDCKIIDSLSGIDGVSDPAIQIKIDSSKANDVYLMDYITLYLEENFGLLYDNQYYGESSLQEIYELKKAIETSLTPGDFKETQLPKTVIPFKIAGGEMLKYTPCMNVDSYVMAYKNLYPISGRNYINDGNLSTRVNLYDVPVLNNDEMLDLAMTQTSIDITDIEVTSDKITFSYDANIAAKLSDYFEINGKYSLGFAIVSSYKTVFFHDSKDVTYIGGELCLETTGSFDIITDNLLDMGSDIFVVAYLEKVVDDTKLITSKYFYPEYSKEDKALEKVYSDILGMDCSVKALFTAKSLYGMVVIDVQVSVINDFDNVEQGQVLTSISGLSFIVTSANDTENTLNTFKIIAAGQIEMPEGLDAGEYRLKYVLVDEDGKRIDFLLSEAIIYSAGVVNLSNIACQTDIMNVEVGEDDSIFEERFGLYKLYAYLEKKGNDNLYYCSSNVVPVKTNISLDQSLNLTKNVHIGTDNGYFQRIHIYTSSLNDGQCINIAVTTSKLG